MGNELEVDSKEQRCGPSLPSLTKAAEFMFKGAVASSQKCRELSQTTQLGVSNLQKLTSNLGSYCLVTKLYLILFEPMDCSPPGSSVHGIFQTGILEWVAISFSKGSSWPRDRTHVSCIGRWILYHWITRKANLESYTLPLWSWRKNLMSP